MPWLDTLLGRTQPPRTEAMPGPGALATPKEAAAFCLEQLYSIVRAEAGHAYLLTAADGPYRLVASQSEPGQSEPAPLTLDRAEVPLQITPAERSGDRWLHLPCGPLLLRVRLRRGQMQPMDLSRAEAFGQSASALVQTAKALFDARQEAERLKHVLGASRLASDAALRPHRTLDLIFHLPLRLLQVVDGGLVLDGLAGEGPTLAASVGRGAVWTVKVLGGVSAQLSAMPPAPDQVSGTALGTLRAEGVRSVVRIPALDGARVIGCAYYFLTEETEVPPAALASLAVQFGAIVRAGGHTAQTASLYLQTLRSLVVAMDGISTYTVGHSDRVALYARMIATELGLPDAAIDAVVLGALLHDIGMIAIDSAAYMKQGQLTSMEYEAVQEHTRIGAELVSPVSAALPLPPMVAHHHERWDGRGYPARLKGKDIPLGARIIAVADLFEAKTTGRAYRRPLPFQRALEDLQSLAGTQLDPEAVAAFGRAYQKLRTQAAPGQPLAPCWEARQIPAALCGACPNRQPQAQGACWEQPGPCANHGENCPTCIVYTEALTREPGQG